MSEFIDVTAINAQVLSSGSLTASGVAHVGTLSGTLQYQESPTITYTPLFGKTLVDQIVSPISVDSLSDIINSGWPIAAVLDFALDRLAPTPEEHFCALNYIEDLWYHDAIIIGPGIYQPDSSTPDPAPNKKKKATKAKSSMPTTSSTKGSTSKVSTSPEGGTGSTAKTTTPADSLVVYFNLDVGLNHPDVLAKWISLLQIYHLSPSENPSPNHCPRASAGGAPPRDMSTQIVLRSIPARPVLLTGGIPIKGGMPSISAPLIRTRSALGILRAGTDYLIGFVSPDQYANIAPKPVENQEEHYSGCRGRKDGYDYKKMVYKSIHTAYYYEVNDDLTDCGDHRIYMLIIRSNSPPMESYVQNFDERSGLYYYIRSDDLISQNNFTLLSLFMIIQAAPGPPPLVPTIAVSR
jgi:hypothetical protein